MNDPLDTKIDDAVRRHYRRHRLDAHRLARILADSQPRARAQRSHRRTLAAALAAAVMALGIGLWVLTASRDDTESRIIQEASVNHRVKLDFDVESSSMDTVSAALHRLDFNLTLPNRLQQGFTLIGARYCTMNGSLAAHLRFLQNDGGEQVSLFMTGDGEAVDGLNSRSGIVDGLAVTAWHENEHYYVLAFN